MRVAVITPYCTESNETLLRCIDSVKNQTRACLHYLIADKPWPTPIDEDVHRHIALGEAHRDYGNTPRAIGSLLAFSEGADAICYLDVDCRYDPDHIETCLVTAKASPSADFVIARRRIELPDGTPVPIEEEPGHIDTNCMFLLRGSHYALSLWALQPKRLSILADRIFSGSLHGLKSVSTDKTTVTYTSNWLAHYQTLGLEPPPDAKETVNTERIAMWWRKLWPDEQVRVLRRLQLPGLWGISAC